MPARSGNAPEPWHNRPPLRGSNELVSGAPDPKNPAFHSSETILPAPTGHMVFTGRCLARRRPARVYRRTVIRAVAGFGEPIELSGGVRVTATHPPDQAARHTKVALSAVQAHRGTEGSDRFP